MKNNKEPLGAYAVRKAGRGLVMTVPQSWADRLGIKSKDRLEVVADGDVLVVRKVEP